MQAVQRARFTKAERVQFEGHGLFPVHSQHALLFESMPAGSSGRYLHPLPSQLQHQLRPVNVQLPGKRAALT